MATVNLNIDQNLDAFGNLRVSQQTTLIDIKQIHDAAPLFIDQVQNATGGTTYNSGESSTTLDTSASGDYAIAQTLQRFNYQSGKSHKIDMTMYGFQAETNITKRIGYFSSATTGNYDTSLDGIFLENDGTNVYIKAYRSGTQVDSVVQSSWDDPCDGTGSAPVVDWSKNQILIMDFQWLGVGIVRFTLNIDGTNYLVHTLKHSNQAATKVYMSSPNQPMRWEIRQTGAGSGSMTYICASVNSEGALNLVGKLLSKDTDNNIVNANTAGTYYAIVGIGLQAAKADAVVDVLDVSLAALTNDSFKWALFLNPSVNGTFNYSAITNSAVETAVGDTSGNPSTNTVTGGTQLASGMMKSGGGGTGAIDKEIKNAIKLGMTIAGVTDKMVLAVTPIGSSSNLDIGGGIGWREQI